VHANFENFIDRLVQAVGEGVDKKQIVATLGRR